LLVDLLLSALKGSEEEKIFNHQLRKLTSTSINRLLWVLFIIFDFFKLQIHLHLEKREYKIYMNPVMASVL
ncbi:hypothetical protein T4B_12870, partial [Trichinella pseudospiralis]